MSEPAKILLVDDEINLLSAIRRKLNARFAVSTATSGPEALETIRKEGPFAVVVSDMRMPGMNGVTLLNEIQTVDPNVVRMMLTGDADQDTAVNAINTGHIFRFFNKPCDPATLERGLNDGVEFHRLQAAEKELIETTLAGSIKLLSEVISLTVPSAGGRRERYRAWARKLSSALSLRKPWELDLAIMLSHVGKISVPHAVLEKDARKQALAIEEQEILSAHAEAGYRLVSNIPRLENVALGIRYQAKNFDGSGKPGGEVAGKDIPELGRVLRLLDGVWAVSGNKDPDQGAFAELRKQEGRYDPEMLDIMARLFGTPAANDDTVQRQMVVDELRIMQLRPGLYLGADIAFPDGRLILAKDSELSELQVERIKSIHKMSKLREPVRVYGWSDNAKGKGVGGPAA